MFDELNVQLAQLETAISRRRGLRQRLDALEQERVRAREAVTYCEAQAQREQDDVTALDGVGGLWSRLTGSYEERAEKEAREAFVALRRLEQAREALAKAEAEYASASGELAEGAELQGEYERLLAHKAMRLQQTQRPEKQDIAALDIEIEARSALLEELGGTLRDGQSALAALGAVLTKLQDASELGVLDQVGMPLAGLQKQLRMGAAVQLMRTADERYRMFFEHLGPLSRLMQGRTDLGLSGTAFADISFDGLAADYWVQGRIRAALSKVESRRDEVRMLLDQIVSDHAKAKAALQAVESERVELIRGLT